MTDGCCSDGLPAVLPAAGGPSAIDRSAITPADANASPQIVLNCSNGWRQLAL
jgi:hypothetical protein